MTKKRGTPDEPWTASWHCNMRHLHQIARGVLPRDWQRYAQFVLRAALEAKRTQQVSTEWYIPLKKAGRRR
jgi:hypothetical protein